MPGGRAKFGRGKLGLAVAVDERAFFFGDLPGLLVADHGGFDDVRAGGGGSGGNSVDDLFAGGELAFGGEGDQAAVVGLGFRLGADQFETFG